MNSWWILLAMTAAAPAREASVSTLSDGTELIYVRTPGVSQASLRVVVRSGGAADPGDMAGLAHLLEHLIFHGSHEVGEDRFFDQIRHAGAYVNAFTSPEYTYYVLDAPLEKMAELGPIYLRMITSPALTLADLDRERGVVATESMLSPGVGMMWAADVAIFPGMTRGATVIGTQRSRERITRSDIQQFFAQYYVPSNMTIIFAGDWELARVTELLEENVLSAPELPEEKITQTRGEPNIPLSEKTSAPFTATLFGFELAGVDRRTCRDLASLLELRATVAAQVRRPLASKVETSCVRLRGHDFLFAIAFSFSYEGGALPDVLRQTFLELAGTAPSARERELIRNSARNAIEAGFANPAQMAEILVREAAHPREPGKKRSLAGALEPPQLNWAAMSSAARKSFRDERRVIIHVSPFGG